MSGCHLLGAAFRGRRLGRVLLLGVGSAAAPDSDATWHDKGRTANAPPGQTALV